MHFQALTTLLSLLPLALSLPNALDTPSPPYFLVTDFGAFITSPAYPKIHSWTIFNVTLVQTDVSQRYSTLCTAHTNGTLFSALERTSCQPAVGPGKENETVSFRFSEDLREVEITRSWDFEK
jgi:hypothetical protein